MFGTIAYQLPEVGVNELDGFVEREILPNYSIIEATKYSTALKLIDKKYKGRQKEPVFVIFIADGNNSDKKETTELITSLSERPIFFQFVGIGGETFPYLKKLDDLKSANLIKIALNRSDNVN